MRRFIFLIGTDTLFVSLSLFLFLQLAELLRPYTVQTTFDHYLLAWVAVGSAGVMYLSKNAMPQAILARLQNFTSRNGSLLSFVRVWQVFLALSAISIITVLVRQELQTTVVYRYQPGQQNPWVTKHDNNLTDSPVILGEKDRVLYLNQPKTPFTARFTDVFESATVRVYYQGPEPEGLAIESDHSRSVPMFVSDEPDIYQRLQEEEWIKQEDVIPDHPELVLYTRPDRPDFFPAFGLFLEQESIDNVVREIPKSVTVFVVKSDRNIQYQSLFDNHDLGFIQYIVLPDRLKHYNLQPVTKAPNDDDTYILELTEKLQGDDRRRGAEYNFRVVLAGYNPGDWATVKKIEVIATRKPVTLQSLMRFLEFSK